MKAKTFMLPVLYNAISILLSSTVTAAAAAAARFQTFMLTAESAHSYQMADGAVFPSSTAIWKSISTWLDRQANQWPKALSSILSLTLKFVSGLNLHPVPTEGRSVYKSGLMTYTQVVCSHSYSAVANCSLPHSLPSQSAETQCW